MKNKINLILKQTAKSIREHEQIDKIIDDNLKSIESEMEELRMCISEEDDEYEREELLEQLSDLREQECYILDLDLDNDNYDDIVDCLDNVLQCSPEEMKDILMEYFHLIAAQNSIEVDDELENIFKALAREYQKSASSTLKKLGVF